MERPKTFSKPDFGEKFAELFGSSGKTISIEMRYSKQVNEFIDKIEKAQKNTKYSTLVFK